MMKVSKSRTYLEYKLMIMNLWGTWHHYPSPLLSCLVMLTVFGYAHCLYDSFMLQVLDQMMIGMFLRPPPPLLLLIYYYSPSVIYGSSCCLPKKWAYLNTVSICMLFFTNSPLLSSLLPMIKLSNSRNCLDMNWWSWTCEELGIVTSRPYFLVWRCSLSLDMLSVFMMPLCSKFLIKWWLAWFWGLPLGLMLHLIILHAQMCSPAYAFFDLTSFWSALFPDAHISCFFQLRFLTSLTMPLVVHVVLHSL